MDPSTSWRTQLTRRVTHAVQQCQERDLLSYLARCPNSHITLLIFSVRCALVLYMLFCHRLLPYFFPGVIDTLTFDTCELLYDDPRFTEVRHWDAVHFYHIARYGYTHENLLVFFPFTPMLIRLVYYVVHDLVPVLHWLAPVSFYMCALNIAASCVAGVVLRKLTVLTFLGPEAVQLLSWGGWADDEVTSDGLHRASSDGKQCTVKEANSRGQLVAAVAARATHAQVGTMLDELPYDWGAARSSSTDSTTNTAPVTGSAAASLERQQQQHQQVHLRWRTVGGAMLLWLMTPAMVFTVAVYTESFFALLCIVGVYYLASYHAALPTATATTSATPTTSSGHAAYRVFPFDEAASGTQGGEGVRWVQPLTTKNELIAMACFFTAATVRSNAFVCVGFLLYPTFIQVCFPATYRRRWELLHGHHYHPDDHPVPPRTVSTLYLPQRFPSLRRLLVLATGCVAIVMPYVVMNYLGWKRYSVHWTPEEQHRVLHDGRRFWRFYGAMQKKYWNVGFLTAYTISNSPNVLVALPVGAMFAIPVWRYYFGPAWRAALVRRDGASGSGVCGAATAVWAVLEQLCQSSNVVYLAGLFFIAFSMMHVQVTNRFVMSSPALYWLGGRLLASAPPVGLLHHLLIVFCVAWNIIGAMFFANHLPWT